MNVVNLSAVRKSILAISLMTAGLVTARADIIQPDATLPPPAGIYTISPACLLLACVNNTRIFGFNNTLDQLIGGNEVVTTAATVSTDVFQNNAGSQGAFIGSVSVLGTLHITYFGRNFAHPLGTFSAQITSFDFMGSFNSHTFEAKENPAIPSTGQTTINQLPSGQFQVSSFFDIFAELSIDGGPFLPSPPRHAELTGTIPEPESAALVLLGAGALLTCRRLRRG